MLKFFYAPNTCALAPYVTLTEANASLTAEAYHFPARRRARKATDRTQNSATRCPSG